jgi:HMG (high mobility group) box
MPKTLDIDGVRSESDEDLTKRQSNNGVKLTRHGHEIPRPKNCFLTYRNEVAAKLIEYGIDNNSRNISKLVANLWRHESENVKQRYRDKAKQEKLKHQEL